MGLWVRTGGALQGVRCTGSGTRHFWVVWFAAIDSAVSAGFKHEWWEVMEERPRGGMSVGDVSMS